MCHGWMKIPISIRFMHHMIVHIAHNNIFIYNIYGRPDKIEILHLLADTRYLSLFSFFFFWFVLLLYHCTDNYPYIYHLDNRVNEWQSAGLFDWDRLTVYRIRIFFNGFRWCVAALEMLSFNKHEIVFFIYFSLIYPHTNKKKKKKNKKRQKRQPHNNRFDNKQFYEQNCTIVAWLWSSC